VKQFIKRVVKKTLIGILEHRGYRVTLIPRAYQSETSKCRLRLAPFCQGNGLDLGPGGDPITPKAVRVDLPTPYAQVGEFPVQLTGDASCLSWFKDSSLDYVYSSHLLEDFVDTESVLKEWLRVLKPGGRLVIFCPDEQIYRKHCSKTGQPYNTNHKHEDFSLEKIKRILDSIGEVRIVHEANVVDIYSWELVAEKDGNYGTPTSS
jgi:predicted SAM-dependent methyltransferase